MIPGFLFFLLIVAWLIDALVNFYLVHIFTLIGKLQMRPPAAIVLIGVTILFLFLISGGAALRSAGHPVLAILVSGSPTIFFLGPYVLFILVILACRPRR
jgi:hypothetical protein